MWRAQGVKRQREEDETQQKGKNDEIKAHPPTGRQAPARPEAMRENRNWTQPQDKMAAHTS